MKKEEKEALQNIYNSSSGLLSQSELINCLPNRDTKISHSLITCGYVEETIRRIKSNQIEATFYRLTEKGQNIFKPFHKRLWFSIKGDVRTVVVSVITALLITFLTLWLTGQFTN
jgi:hypothetical protein